MSIEYSQETKKENCYGPQDDFKNNQRITAAHTTRDRKANLEDIFNLSLVKAEPKEIIVGSNPKTLMLQDNKINSDIQSINDNLDASNLQLNSVVIIKGYTSIAVKEEPMDDFDSIFRDNNLDYEKRIFHQDILNKIVKNMDLSIQVKELQNCYIGHLLTIAELEILACSTCNYKTLHKANLRSHLYLIHKQEMDATWFKCPSCSHKFKKCENLKKHLASKHESYNNNKNNEIEIKRNIIENPTKRKKHATTNSEYDCDLCNFKTGIPDFFEKHKATHKDPDNPTRFLCYVCCYGHTNKTILARHLLQTHQVVTKRANQIKELNCNFCDYKCHTTQYLNRHLLIHKTPGEITMLSCTYCDFKTKYRMSLNYHMKNHKLTDEQLRKYMCEICSKRFKQKAKLDLHVITHKSIDQVSQIFKCSECPFRAKIKRNLEMHLSVHKEPEFVCDICGHRSKRKDAHNRHKLTHKGNDTFKTYKCSLCTYETHIKYYLKKHFKKHSTQSG